MENIIEKINNFFKINTKKLFDSNSTTIRKSKIKYARILEYLAYYLNINYTKEKGVVKVNNDVNYYTLFDKKNKKY